jgi:hypothetical protein
MMASYSADFVEGIGLGLMLHHGCDGDHDRGRSDGCRGNGRIGIRQEEQANSMVLNGQGH